MDGKAILLLNNSVSQDNGTVWARKGKDKVNACMYLIAGRHIKRTIEVVAID